MTVQSCPNWETMQHLLAGTLHGSEAEQLETHLLECEQCLSVARTVPANDDLVAAIRARREFSEDTGVLDQAIQQAKQLHAEQMQALTGGLNLPGLSDALGQLCGSPTE